MAVGPADLPSPEWRRDDATYRIAPLSPESWDVSRDARNVGILVLLLDGPEPAWTIRDEANPVLGIGGSWPTWSEALLELVEHRERDEAARAEGSRA